MAIYEKNGCKIVLSDDSLGSCICFDQRIAYIAKGAAGGYFERLEAIAAKIRLMSTGKFCLDLSRVEDGVIQIVDNLAITSSFNIADGIDEIINTIVSARIS